MRRHGWQLLVGVLLTVGAVALMVWSVPYATTGRSLYLFERETPTEVVNGSARQGAGPLGLDVVTLNDGRVRDVARQGEPRAQWPRPEFLVGEHGARYADEPASSGAWWPFALRAVAAWIVAFAALVVGVVWIVRYLPPFLGQLGFVIFGQRDRDARAPTWVTGAGGHGSGGGQVPPHVPYNPDWDPKNRRA